MMIELRFDATKAIIDQQGGWLTNLADNRGDILFPKRDFELENGQLKQRGGCHVCLPNFGPAGSQDQPQHGFGREVQWNIEDVGDNYALLTLPEGPGKYKGLSSHLTYMLNEASLELTLEVTNTSSNDELWVAPGFHPYFYLPGDETEAVINGENVALSELMETKFTTSNVQSLMTMHREITLKSEGLPIWAQWTDRLGSYVCIEPTLGGYAFLKETPDTSELLAPGEQKQYRLTIAWWSPLEK